MEKLYRVKKGEKLCEIANFFNTTIEQIKHDNNLTCPIKENQLLVLQENIGKIFIVKPLCNLDKLREKLNGYETSFFSELYPLQRIKIYKKNK